MEKKENNALTDSQNEKAVDIQRNKELFEYEMTEVKLMLSGRFKNLSAKDMNNAGTDVVVKKADFQFKKPEMLNKKNISSSVPAVSAKKIPQSEFKAQKGEVTITSEKIESKKAVFSVPTVNIDYSELNCPQIQKSDFCAQNDGNSSLAQTNVSAGKAFPTMSFKTLKVNIPKAEQHTSVNAEKSLGIKQFTLSKTKSDGLSLKMKEISQVKCPTLRYESADYTVNCECTLPSERDVSCFKKVHGCNVNASCDCTVKEVKLPTTNGITAPFEIESAVEKIAPPEKLKLSYSVFDGIAVNVNGTEQIDEKKCCFGTINFENNTNPVYNIPIKAYTSPSDITKPDIDVAEMKVEPISSITDVTVKVMDISKNIFPKWLSYDEMCKKCVVPIRKIDYTSAMEDIVDTFKSERS